MSAVWPVVLLVCATLPGYLVMVSVKPETTSQVVRVLVCLGLMAVFTVLVGAVASSLFRSTAVSTAVSYMVLAAVCIAPLLIWLGRDAPFGHQVVRTALVVDPVAAALNVADMPGFGVTTWSPQLVGTGKRSACSSHCVGRPHPATVSTD